MPESQPEPTTVYCAGPLFNPAERAEMTEIADKLVGAGFAVYLPHRDGMEFRKILDVFEARGWAKPVAAQFLHAAIFALDVYQLAERCQCMVWNLNGRVPDEGAVSEAAMAWTLAKPLVGFTNDVRSLIEGRINPLLVGMLDFQTVDSIEAIPEALRIALAAPEQAMPHPMAARMQQAVDDGRQLWNCLLAEGAQSHNRVIADVVEDLFGPQQENSIADTTAGNA